MPGTPQALRGGPCAGAAKERPALRAEEPWHITLGDNLVYADTAEHRSMVCRILRVDESLWRRAVDEYARRLDGDSVSARLKALREAWDLCSPHAAPAGKNAGAAPCLICGAHAMAPAVRRLPADTFGLCASCGHGALLSAPAGASVYRATDYYERQSPGGVGYAAYLEEREYREAKADALLEWVETAGRRPVGSLLEVGSAYGYTRRAAERRGWSTMGVDLNPHAAAGARSLYGLETFTGSLSEALDSGAVKRRAWDLVVYQFVLEHVPDPVAELRAAAEALVPTGAVVVLAPSMQAVERVVFGASYRSLRPDHLHLFSWRSLDRCFHDAGLRRSAWKSQCSVHLLAGFLSASELDGIYQRGDGPDMAAVAERVYP